MEPFLTVKCIKSLKEKGLDVRKLIMDDDSTTFLRTKKAVPNITKSSDKNHVVRNLSNALYKVKETHGGLSVKTIKYFKKCFAYTIQQNKNDVEGIRKNLYATVPHAFGDHSQCNSSWCGFLKDPSTYRHKSLPSGKDLVGEKLREALQDVFQKHAEKAEKYIDLGSSNANENLNQMIAKKAPKAQHYSGSESLSYRVAAAVAQKNEGHKYILQVNSACNLSPGKQTEKRQNLLDKKRSTKHQFQGTYKAKVERLKLREQRQTSETTMELCEGTTYATDIELSATNDELEDLITEIPMSERKPSKISPLSPETSSIIVADLETTGLATDSSIIQIAASSYCTEDTFSSFIRPQNGYIPKTVSKLTGIELHGLTMFSDMVPVRSMGEKEALLKFVEWMRKYDSVLIVAHNACFDARILISAFNRHGITDHLKSIVGFSDSIKVFKKAFPSQSSYKLQHLVQQFGTDLPPVQAHNAVNDVLVLRHMLLKIPSASDSLRQSAFSVEHVSLQIKKAQNKQKNLDGYDQLISQNVLTKTQCSSLASHGLSVKHVQLTFNRAGVDGLKDVLKGKIKKISIAAEKLARHFSQATS
ncbi:uncharacterized protein LOC134261717 [Saccostrea cucullata]|uniref:uncharacterized protein LOC134261717 n=1 Tax=Saccostrea cuccullata TaxID=36930 RepID=UPI002ED65CDE